MSTTSRPVAPPLPPPFDALAALPLVETDGEPLETPWHRMAINLLIEAIVFLFRDRDDFVGGNMFLYYSDEQVRNRDYRGPDFFYVNGVDRHRPRQWWAVWQEGGRVPDVIIELLSDSTAEEDRTTKKTIYERTLRTPEYFLYDPATQELEGWRIGPRGRYQRIPPDERGWVWSEQLELWLGTWVGSFQENRATWLRFYDAEGNLVLRAEEAQLQRAEAQQQRADTERQRAEAERQRADAQQQRADTQQQRAEAAEVELQRLRKALEDLRQRLPSSEPPQE